MTCFIADFRPPFQIVSIRSNVNLKVKQVVCLEAIYRGRDVAVLPMVYGKSIIFHLLPSLFLDKIKCENQAAPSLVITDVSPLNALIKVTTDAISSYTAKENISKKIPSVQMPAEVKISFALGFSYLTVKIYKNVYRHVLFFSIRETKWPLYKSHSCFNLEISLLEFCCCNLIG